MTTRMINDLKEVLDDIEQRSDKDHRFVQSIIIKKEENPNKPLTGPQFRYLQDCHNRYCR